MSADSLPVWVDFSEAEIDAMFETVRRLSSVDSQQMATREAVGAILFRLPLAMRLIPSPVRYFRARRWDREDRPERGGEISLRVQGEGDDHHRAGFPRIPLFYAANSKEGALIETGASVGDRFVVSEWEVTQSLAAIHVGFDPQVWVDWGRKDGQIVPLGFPGEKVEGIPAEKRQLVLTRIALEFVRDFSKTDPDRYKVSAALARELGLSGESTTIFKRHSKMVGAPTDALVYPSVATRGHAQNIAVRRSSVERCLRLLCCSLYEVMSVDEGNVAVSEIDFATYDPDADCCDWKGRRGMLLIDDRVTLRAVGHDSWAIEGPENRPIYRG